jgi:catechol 2,3-dioxygenase
MQIKELGHIVLYVRNLEIMTDFYERVLGFKAIGKMHGATAFSAGRTHHEMLLIEIGENYQKHPSLQPGLYHIGFKIGDTDDDLREALEVIKKENVRLVGATDHNVTHSLYILDPEDNELELYIDTGDDWKTNPDLLFTPPKRLQL